MKLFLVLATVLVGAAAMAMPTVGDKTSYDLNASKDGQSVSGTVERELVGLDVTSDQYKVKTVVNINGQSQTQESTGKASELPTDALIAGILLNCGSQGGTPETVTTAAGEFEACAFSWDDADSKGKVWVSKVPFGVVKNESTDKNNGVLTVLTLKSYTLGQ